MYWRPKWFFFVHPFYYNSLDFFVLNVVVESVAYSILVLDLLWATHWFNCLHIVFIPYK